MTCDSQTLLAAAKCFECIPPGMQSTVQTYLLASIAGGSMDVATLMRDARCFTACLPPSLMAEIKTHLLCEIVDNLPSPEPPAPECDADALAFIAAANITDDNQHAAICRLVQDLKTYPLSGTKYWDREILIYPLVGGNAASHSINLKNPAGPNNLSYVGAGLIHSAFGIQGDGVASYASTQFLVPSQNSFRGMMYIDIGATITGMAHYGTTSGPLFNSRRFTGGRIEYAVNDATATTTAGVLPMGCIIIERYEVATKRIASGVGVWDFSNVNSTGIPNRHILLFARNAGGVAPVGTGANFCNARISSFSFGSPLDTDGGNSEHLEYKSIWDRFNNFLSRGHP